MIFHKSYKHEQYGKSRSTNAPKEDMTSERRGEIYDMARAEEGVRLKTNKDRNLSMQPSGIEAAYLKDGFDGVEAHIKARDAIKTELTKTLGVDPYS